LQTAEYAEAVIDTNMPKLDAATVQRNVRARMDRSAQLGKAEPLELWVVLDEAAIRRVVGGPDVMRGQLKRLIEDSQKKNVILQILPFSAGVHPGMAGCFTLLDFKDPADPELVYVEGIAGDQLIEGHPQIRRFGIIFDQLRAMALSPRDSMGLIAMTAEQLH
jgi:hypothetical protein